MENIFYYLKWRGDLSFETSQFNDVDNLIFCAISYLKFDDCLKPYEVLTIKELFEKYKSSLKKDNIFFKNNEKLFSLLSESVRFKNIQVARYERVNDKSIEKQFGAMTFILPVNNLVIVYSHMQIMLTRLVELLNTLEIKDMFL